MSLHVIIMKPEANSAQINKGIRSATFWPRRGELKTKGNKAPSPPVLFSLLGRHAD